MKVKEILDLLSYGVPFELIDAMTGKRLCCSWINRKETIEKYHDCTVTYSPVHVGLFTRNIIGNDYTYPHIRIWVTGK